MGQLGNFKSTKIELLCQTTKKSHPQTKLPKQYDMFLVLYSNLLG